MRGMRLSKLRLDNREEMVKPLEVTDQVTKAGVTLASTSVRHSNKCSQSGESCGIVCVQLDTGHRQSLKRVRLRAFRRAIDDFTRPCSRATSQNFSHRFFDLRTRLV